MIDIDDLIKRLDIPDGMSVDEMRKVVVDVLDIARASNDAEKAISDENTTLKAENERLGKQNLDLFNRVTTSMTASQKEDVEEENEDVTTEDILEYYS